MGQMQQEKFGPGPRLIWTVLWMRSGPGPGPGCEGSAKFQTHTARHSPATLSWHGSTVPHATSPPVLANVRAFLTNAKPEPICTLRLQTLRNDHNDQSPPTHASAIASGAREQNMPLQEMFQARLGTRTERPASHSVLYGHCVEIGYNVIRTTSERPYHRMGRVGFCSGICVCWWSTDTLFIRTPHIADGKASRCFVLNKPQWSLEVSCTGDRYCVATAAGVPGRCSTPASQGVVGKAPCSPPISASLCIFCLVIETLGLAGHRQSPFTVGLLPGAACLSRLH
jgi:hypothetical protein